MFFTPIRYSFADVDAVEYQKFAKPILIREYPPPAFTATRPP
jgi:hypothetical protein